MRVLVACEFSGAVRDAFTARGHDAMSCDLLPAETPGKHYQGDALDLAGEPFDLVIAHPPCTYLSNSGVRWLDTEPGRWARLEVAAGFFAAMARFSAPRIAIENPIQHRHAIARHGLGRPHQVIQPWMFGHPETKATGLWLYGLPPLMPTSDEREFMATLPAMERNRIHYVPPGADRGRVRSVTFAGIADAMADQWTRQEAVA